MSPNEALGWIKHGEQCTRYAEAIETLTNALRDAEADARRLDWLQNKAVTSTVYMNNQHPWNVSGNHRFRDLKGPTFRAAIDQAMQP
jgi:hypothetical protein